MFSLKNPLLVCVMLPLIGTGVACAQTAYQKERSRLHVERDRAVQAATDPILQRCRQALAESPVSDGGSQDQTVEVLVPNLRTFTLAIHNQSSNWMPIEAIALG